MNGAESLVRTLIASGIDTADGDWRLVFREGRARLGVPRDVPNADGTGTIVGGSSPVQMGAMSRVLFTPRGTATQPLAGQAWTPQHRLGTGTEAPVPHRRLVHQTLPVLSLRK